MSNILQQLSLENISDKATAYTVGGTPAVTYIFIALSAIMLGYMFTHQDAALAPAAAAVVVEEEKAEADVVGGGRRKRKSGRQTKKKRITSTKGTKKK
jgi:hypothetical protein